MSNENYNVEVKEEKCLCHSKWFKKLLITTFGTFFGVLFALCLFTALHKPAMPPACPCGCGCPKMHPAMYYQHYFDKCHKAKMVRDVHERKAPVREEIEN